MSSFDPKRGSIYGDAFGKIRIEKIEIPREQHQLSGGCGDLNCPECYPRDGRRPDGRSPGGARSPFEEALRFSIREIAFGSGDPFASRSDTASDTEYRQAKEKVEKYLLKPDQSVGWDDVVGNDAARTSLVEAIEHPAKYSELYEFYGKKPLKGVMLYGPPGCGKTMFGKAAAAVVGRLHGTSAMLLKVNGPEIQTPFVGQTEEIIRNIFGFARAYKKKHGHPLVIFIDEADSILPPRDATSASFHASNVAAFLSEMDGIEESGAFVLLATNRPNAIDPAILRDGRIDRRIRVERPTREAALVILCNALKDAPRVAESVGLLAEHACNAFYSDENTLALVGRAEMVNSTPAIEYHKFLLYHMVNGAMLVGLVERAKGIAFRRDLESGTRSGVIPEDLTQAVAEVLTETRATNYEAAAREFGESLPPPAATAGESADIPRILN